MSVYGDHETLKKLFDEFWTELLEDPQVGPRLKETGLTIAFRIKDPDVDMYIDEEGVKWDAEARSMKPILTLAMSADVVHQFWLRKLNVARALATRQVRTRGPVPKFMKLLPLVDPGYTLYREYCVKYGLPTE